MEAGFRLTDSRIAILGLGLMGGSLALALNGKCAALYGIDLDQATLKLAREKEIVEEADSNPAKLLPRAHLVVLATPVLAIIDWIRKLPSLIQESCIILDLGSTKKDIVQAMSALPQQFDPMGGHPICGKEKLGLENADAGLFENAPFVIVPLARTTLRARNAAEQIISAIGARRIDMNAEEHDRALAFTSHLPFLLSSALALSTPNQYSRLIGTGFRSTSRLAGTPSSIMSGILASNRENVMNALSKFQEQLAQIGASLMSEDYVALESLLGQSRSAYHAQVDN